MTTIAYRDGVLAADTLVTAGSNRDGYTTKIAKRGRCLAAVTGNQAFGRRFIDWFSAGMVGDAPSMGTDEEIRATGLIFMPDGLIVTLGLVGWNSLRAPYYAEGAGHQYACGAMACGAGAEDAVRAAIMHDISSGGEVQVLRHCDSP